MTSRSGLYYTTGQSRPRNLHGASNCTLITQILPSFVTITSVIIFRDGKILTRSKSRSVKCLHFTETLDIDSLEQSILLLNK